MAFHAEGKEYPTKDEAVHHAILAAQELAKTDQDKAKADKPEISTVDLEKIKGSVLVAKDVFRVFSDGSVENL